MVASSVGEEGLRGVNGGEAGARKEGEVTAGQSAAKPILSQFAGTRWHLVRDAARVRVRRHSLRPAGWTVGRTGRQLALSRAGYINLSMVEALVQMQIH